MISCNKQENIKHFVCKKQNMWKCHKFTPETDTSVWPSHMWYTWSFTFPWKHFITTKNKVLRTTGLNTFCIRICCHYRFKGLFSILHVCMQIFFAVTWKCPIDARVFDSIVTGSNGKYWSVGSDGSINADSNEAHPFQFELCGQSRFYVRASNGCYIKGEQNGIFNASADLSKATKWEY